MSVGRAGRAGRSVLPTGLIPAARAGLPPPVWSPVPFSFGFVGMPVGAGRRVPVVLVLVEVVVVTGGTYAETACLPKYSTPCQYWAGGVKSPQ